MGGGGGGGEGEPEFQIAPMIDVLLVLLIFFMSITTTQVLKVDKSIKLPLSQNSIKRDQQRSEAIVNVLWNPQTKKATYKMDDVTYPVLADLSKALAERKKAGDAQVGASPALQFRVVIRGDREASAVAVSRAMEAAGEAGISDISYSTVNKD
jgi:biopolymer transport protein ExbD